MKIQWSKEKGKKGKKTTQKTKRTPLKTRMN
jgi:hypothetical protein